MWRDPIVEEVRELRDAYAQQFNYDLQAIHRDLKGQERASGRKIVSLPPKRRRAVEQMTAQEDEVVRPTQAAPTIVAAKGGSA